MHHPVNTLLLLGVVHVLKELRDGRVVGATRICRRLEVHLHRPQRERNDRPSLPLIEQGRPVEDRDRKGRGPEGRRRRHVGRDLEVVVVAPPQLFTPLVWFGSVTPLNPTPLELPHVQGRLLEGHPSDQ